MDVIFDPPNGKSFSIEVGFFDTILEIKQKIERYHAIPISSQTLVFNRQVLQDERDVADCEILQNSHVRLIVDSDNFDMATSTDEAVIDVDEDSPAPLFAHKKISLNLKIPTPKPHVVPVEMDVNDTVSSLKDKIQEMEPSVVSAKRLVLHSSSGLVELQDERSLSECELSEKAEIEVSLKRSPRAAVVVAGPKKLKLAVVSKCGIKRAFVEMSPHDNVAELRKELEKRRQMGIQFPLPADGYFFIYRQNVMDEDKSFRWHHVSNGDSIDIFNGSVTGGS